MLFITQLIRQWFAGKLMNAKKLGMTVGLALAYLCGFSVRLGPYGTECPHCHGQIPSHTSTEKDSPNE